MQAIRRERRFINFAMLLKVMGWLLMMESAFMLAPTFVCVYYGESDWQPFAGAAAFTALTGLIMTRRIKARTSKMGRREGFLLTASVWVVFSIFGMIPLMFSANPLSLTDAFFETISGFTTTGATIYPDPEILSHGVHIWRAMMQWIGGMGIILFTLAVIPMLNSAGGMQMFNAEVTGITHDKVRPRISQTAKALWTTYITLTVICATLLALGPMDLFDAICYAFGTSSTGGYSTKQSIEYFNSDYCKIVVTIFMFLSSVNFALIIRSIFNGPKRLFQDEVFRAFLAITLIATLFIMVTLLVNGHASSGSDVFIDPLFQVVSAFTSTGYAIGSFSSWGLFVMAMLIVLVFIGGCSGSTTGGVKLDRILFLSKYCRNELYRCIHPNAVMSVRVNGKVQSPSVVQKVAVFFCLFVGLLTLGLWIMTLAGMSPGDSFISGIICVSNSALDLGYTSFGSNFAVIPDTAKWTLGTMMLIGRLELFTVLILFTPAFWRK